MKKSIYKVVSLIVIMAIALTMTAFAEGEAVISLGSATEVNVGERVLITVDLQISEKVNSIGIFDLQYDENVLKFIGFSENTEINEKAMFKTWETDPVAVVLGLKESVTFEGENTKLCALEFETLKPGETEITVSGVIKENSTEFKVTYINGKVIVSGNINETDINKNENQENEEQAKEFTSKERAEDVICLKIDNPTAFACGKYGLIDSSNEKVVPYIKNDRTLVPLRFVSETLGAQVEWENGWNYCYVNKGNKKIKITFGSADIEVNGEVITYDAPVEVVEDRTMVPIRFISEELGYHVYWNQPNKVVIITPADNPWVEKRSAENDLLLDMLVTFLLNGMM